MLSIPTPRTPIGESGFSCDRFGSGPELTTNVNEHQRTAMNTNVDVRRRRCRRCRALSSLSCADTKKTAVRRCRTAVGAFVGAFITNNWIPVEGLTIYSV